MESNIYRTLRHHMASAVLRNLWIPFQRINSSYTSKSVTMPASSLFRSLFGGDDAAIPLPHFKKMSHHDRQLLAAILSNQPSPSTLQSSKLWVDYKLGTKRLIAELPEHLRSYPGKIERFLNKHIEDDARSQMRALCPIHDKLNRRVVRSTLAWIKKEIDINIPAIIDPLGKAGHLTESDNKLFDRLRDTSGMWLDSGHFWDFFKRSVHPKWARQADRCAACVVSRLASDVKVIRALNAGMMIGRTNPGESRRMAYMECMIDRLADADREKVREESLKLGRRLHQKFQEWEASQAGAADASGDQGTTVSDAQPGSARHSIREDEPSVFDPAQIPRPATPRGSIQRQPSHSRTPSRKMSDPVSPRSSVYEPIPWRKPQWQQQEQQPQPASRRPTKQVQRRDTVGDLIDAYRHDTYEPTLGREDHFGFKEEDEVEEWPSQAMVDEILAEYKKNHATRLAAEAAGVPNARDPPSPPGQFRMSTARPSTAGGRPPFAPAPAPFSSTGPLREFAPAARRDYAASAGPRRSSSVYTARPPTEAGPRGPQGIPPGGAKMALARLSAEQMAQEYQNAIGRINPFRRPRAESVASDMTMWPRYSQGQISYSQK
jgi:hypothetical protein